VDLLDQFIQYCHHFKKFTIQDNNWTQNAATLGQYEVIQLLVDKYGYDIHASNERPLMLAVKEGHCDCVKLLLEKYGNDMCFYGVKRAMDKAETLGHKSIVNIIKKHHENRYIEDCRIDRILLKQ
jgi:ankyrin repeat protein